jgi:hypothetical protein
MTVAFDIDGRMGELQRLLNEHTHRVPVLESFRRARLMA